MKMSDVWGENYELTYSTYPSPHFHGEEYGMLFNNEEPCKAICYAVNNHDALTETLRLKEEECKQLAQDKDEFLSVLTDISNMCIGEIAMGRSIDAQSVGEMIFAATGLTNPELNEREKHK